MRTAKFKLEEEGETGGSDDSENRGAGLYDTGSDEYVPNRAEALAKARHDTEIQERWPEVARMLQESGIFFGVC